jgi:uncharacterized Fe-S center protein
MNAQGARAGAVYFLKLTEGNGDGIVEGIGPLLDSSGVACVLSAKGSVAVKMHFGESNETGHVRPRFVRRIVAWLASSGARPFLTDTNTLYRGNRGNSLDHTRAAAEHGFSFSSLGVPIIIGDGVRGTNDLRVPVSGQYVKDASIGAEFGQIDSMFSLAHFKGHELSGFGGAMKNVGMGCAARAGKLDMHSDTVPYARASCTGCGVCMSWCPVGAVSIDGAAVVDEEKCIGCGQCLAVCPESAMSIKWNESTDIFQRKMVEYVKAVVSLLKGRICYVNFITDVHPVCDCYGGAKLPIAPDIGVVASMDPVAIDQASYDLVNGARPTKDGGLSGGYRQGEDKFRDLHPDVDPTVQLRYAEELGLGTRNYRIIEVSE